MFKPNLSGCKRYLFWLTIHFPTTACWVFVQLIQKHESTSILLWEKWGNVCVPGNRHFY